MAIARDFLSESSIALAIRSLDRSLSSRLRNFLSHPLFSRLILQALGFTMFNPTYGLDRERLWSCWAAVGQSGLGPAYHLVGTGVFCG